MRYVPHFFDNSDDGFYIGNKQAHGRVTVEPYWHLRETTPVYGKSIRGPYRWYIDPDRLEVEVPAIKSISWNRGVSQDFASCTIVIYNTWHNRNLEAPELDGQFGKPGYFWPHRGKGDSAATWEQEPGVGAYDYDGNWIPDFSWTDVLVEDALLRTYEGRGDRPRDGSYVPIANSVEDQNLLQTGVWIIDSVVAGADGLMTLNCTDIGRILLDQIVFPPVIPPAIYPLEYYPPGTSAFDSPWGPPVAPELAIGQDTISIYEGSKGEVWFGYHDASSRTLSNVNSQYPYTNSLDGSWKTFALTEAYAAPGDGFPWFEFVPGAGPSRSPVAEINSMQIKFWAGGYTAYISIRENGVWQGSETIPGGSNLPYVKKVQVPLALQDGNEPPFDIDFSDIAESADDEIQVMRTIKSYDADRVRVTLTDLYYSGIPGNSGQMYRGGIRDITFYRISEGKAPELGDLDFNELNWTYAMAPHPVKGYWVVESTGVTQGFGDAADYDSTSGEIGTTFKTRRTTGQGWNNEFIDGIETTLHDIYGEMVQTNRVVGMAAQHDGVGYWLVDWRGQVYCLGSALHYGNVIVSDPYVNFWEHGKLQARGIAATHTGEGYWVLYSNGVIHGFGDASINGQNYFVIPTSATADYWHDYLYNKTKNTPWPTEYYILLKGTGIAAHPSKMGFWVTDGCGQVWAFGESQFHGQLNGREYAHGMAGSFKLDDMEWATCIAAATDGEGYWVGFGSGKVASFGSATKIGKNPYVFEDIGGIYPENVIKPDDTEINPEGFRRIMWSLAPDPDGEGFWVLNAAGGVKGYKADFWGQPGYTGQTGLRFKEGNFNGDWTEIVREILLWGGFLAYDGSIAGSEMPAVYGALESTGIYTATDVPQDKFDKSTLIDVIKELADVVGYIFRIDEEGRAIFSSPNWWQSGNFDQDGVPIIVGGQRYVPVIHEDSNLLGYSATLSGTDKLSKLYVGSDLPNAKFPDRKGFITFVPPQARATVSGGVNTMRGINRPGIWISQLEMSELEYKLMAEQLSIRAWFGARLGQATIVGNPALSIDDQIRLVERNTSESFIHLIQSISSSLDNDTGIYTMDISTVWLGDADSWVITTDPLLVDDYSYVVISNELNSWQLRTNRGLVSGGSGFVSSVNAYGEFSSLTAYSSDDWTFSGTFTCFGPIENFRIEVQSFANLGESAFLEITPLVNGVRTSQPIAGRYIEFENQILTNLGNYSALEPTSYEYEINGTGMSTGQGRLNLVFRSDSTSDSVVADSIVFTASPVAIGPEVPPLPTMTTNFSFTEESVSIPVVAKMVVLGDSMSYLDSTLDGLTGDNWPNLLVDAGSVENMYNGSMTEYTSDDLVNTPIVEAGSVTDVDVVVLFVGAYDQNEWLSGVTVLEFTNNLSALLDDYPADQQVLIFPWPWTN